jgi:hypothetical protein
VSVDFAQAFRDGCRSEPTEFISHTEVEDVIERFCSELEGATGVLAMGRIGVEMILGQARECSVPIASKGPPHRDGGGWVRVLMHRSGGKISPTSGVDLVAYKRADDGFPVTIRFPIGSTVECKTAEALEAALAAMLRDVHLNARIRKTVRDFSGKASR